MAAATISKHLINDASVHCYQRKNILQPRCHLQMEAATVVATKNHKYPGLMDSKLKTLTNAQ